MPDTTTISQRRLDIAKHHADDSLTRELIEHAEDCKLEWRHVANMLACNLQRVDHALRGDAVYDYEQQEWLDADK